MLIPPHPDSKELMDIFQKARLVKLHGIAVQPEKPKDGDYVFIGYVLQTESWRIGVCVVKEVTEVLYDHVTSRDSLIVEEYPYDIVAFSELTINGLKFIETKDGYQSKEQFNGNNFKIIDIEESYKVFENIPNDIKSLFG